MSTQQTGARATAASSAICSTGGTSKNEIKVSAEGVAQLTFNFLDELHGDSSLEPGEVKTPPHGSSPVPSICTPPNTVAPKAETAFSIVEKLSPNNVAPQKEETTRTKTTVMKLCKSISQLEADACKEKVRAILELDEIKRKQEAEKRKELMEKRRQSGEVDEDEEKKKKAKEERKRIKRLKKEQKAARLALLSDKDDDDDDNDDDDGGDDNDDEDEEGIIKSKKKKKKRKHSQEDPDSYCLTHPSPEERNGNYSATAGAASVMSPANCYHHMALNGPPPLHLNPFPPNDAFIGFRPMNPFMRGPRPDFHLPRGGFLARHCRGGAMRGNLRFPGYRPQQFYGNIGMGQPRHHGPVHRTPPPARGHSPIQPPQVDLLWTKSTPSISYAFNPRLMVRPKTAEHGKIGNQIDKSVERSPKTCKEEFKKLKKLQEREKVKKRRSSRNSSEKSSKRKIEKIRKSMNKPERRLSSVLAAEVNKQKEEQSLKKQTETAVNKQKEEQSLKKQTETTGSSPASTPPPSPSSKQDKNSAIKAQDMWSVIENIKVEKYGTDNDIVVAASKEMATPLELMKPAEVVVKKEAIEKNQMNLKRSLETAAPNGDDSTKAFDMFADSPPFPPPHSSSSQSRAHTKTKENDLKNRKETLKTAQSSEVPTKNVPLSSELMTTPIRLLKKMPDGDCTPSPTTISLAKLPEKTSLQKAIEIQKRIDQLLQEDDLKLETIQENKKKLLERTKKHVKSQIEASITASAKPIVLAKLRSHTPDQVVPVVSVAKHRNPFKRSNSRERFFNKRHSRSRDRDRNREPDRDISSKRKSSMERNRSIGIRKFQQKSLNRSYSRERDYRTSSINGSELNRSHSNEKDRDRMNDSSSLRYRRGDDSYRRFSKSPRTYQRDHFSADKTRLSERKRYRSTTPPQTAKREQQKVETKTSAISKVQPSPKFILSQKNDARSNGNTIAGDGNGNCEKRVKKSLSKMHPIDDECDGTVSSSRRATHKQDHSLRDDHAAAATDSSPDTDDYMDNWENDDADMDINSNTAACESSTPLRSSSTPPRPARLSRPPPVHDRVQTPLRNEGSIDIKFETRLLNPSPPTTPLSAATSMKTLSPQETNVQVEKSTTPTTSPPQTPPQPLSANLETNLSKCKSQLFGMQQIYDEFIKSVEATGVDIKMTPTKSKSPPIPNLSPVRIELQSNKNVSASSSSSSSSSSSDDASDSGSSSSSASSSSASSSSSSSSGSTSPSSSDESNDCIDSFNVTNNLDDTTLNAVSISNLEKEEKGGEETEVSPNNGNSSDKNVLLKSDEMQMRKAGVVNALKSCDVTSTSASESATPPSTPLLITTISSIESAATIPASLTPPPQPATTSQPPPSKSSSATSVKSQKSDAAKDFKKLKSLEANLSRIQMMRANYDSADEISEELLKMEKLFLQEKNLILQKYAKSTPPSTPGAAARSTESPEGYHAIPALEITPPILMASSATGHQFVQSLQQNETQMETETGTDEKLAVADKIFDANREAIKLTISPMKLPRTPAIFGKAHDYDSSAKSSTQNSAEPDEADFTDKLLVKPAPVKEIAIVKPMMESKESRASHQRHRRQQSPAAVASSRPLYDRSRSPATGRSDRNSRRSTSRSRFGSSPPHRRGRMRSLSISPSRVERGGGRHVSPQRRTMGSGTGGGGGNGGYATQSRHRYAGRRSRSRSRSTSRQINNRRGRGGSGGDNLSPLRRRQRQPPTSAASTTSLGHRKNIQQQQHQQSQHRSFRDSRSRSPRSPANAGVGGPGRYMHRSPHSPRSPRRRSYSRDRYSRSPLPFKPPSPPMRRSLSPDVRRSNSLSPKPRSSHHHKRRSRSHSRSRSPGSSVGARRPRSPRSPPVSRYDELQRCPPRGRRRRANSYDRRSSLTPSPMGHHDQQQQYYAEEGVAADNAIESPSSSYYHYNVSPSRISLDARINIVLNGPSPTGQDVGNVSGGAVGGGIGNNIVSYESYTNYSQYGGAAYMSLPPDTTGNYYANQYVPMSQTHAQTHSHQQIYSNIPTISGGGGNGNGGMGTQHHTHAHPHPAHNFYYGFNDNAAHPVAPHQQQQQPAHHQTSSFLKELPKATVAVQKGNVLEIVPSNEVPSLDVAVESKAADQMPAKSAKSKRTAISWKEEVNNRHVRAAVMRLSRENDGSSRSILKRSDAVSVDIANDEKLSKKKVYFEDGIFPNRDSDDEDRKIIDDKIRRALRRLRKRHGITIEAGSLIADKPRDERTKIDPALEKLPPPPPPLGATPLQLEQPIYLRPPTPTPLLYFHFDPVVHSMYVSQLERPIPPRLLNAKCSTIGNSNNSGGSVSGGNVGGGASNVALSHHNSAGTQSPSSHQLAHAHTHSHSPIGIHATSKKDLNTLAALNRSTAQRSNERGSPKMMMPIPPTLGSASIHQNQPPATPPSPQSMPAFQAISSASGLPQLSSPHPHPSIHRQQPPQQSTSPIGFAGMRIHNFSRLPPSPLTRGGGITQNPHHHLHPLPPSSLSLTSHPMHAMPPHHHHNSHHNGNGHNNNNIPVVGGVRHQNYNRPPPSILTPQSPSSTALQTPPPTMAHEFIAQQQHPTYSLPPPLSHHFVSSQHQQHQPQNMFTPTYRQPPPMSRPTLQSPTSSIAPVPSVSTLISTLEPMPPLQCPLIVCETKESTNAATSTTAIPTATIAQVNALKDSSPHALVAPFNINKS